MDVFFKTNNSPASALKTHFTHQREQKTEPEERTMN